MAAGAAAGTRAGSGLGLLARGPRLVDLVLAAVGAALVGVLAYVSLSSTPLDLAIYRWGGEFARSYQDRLYTGSFTETLAFTYTPFAALVFAPLAALSVSVASWVMFVASVAALARTSQLVGMELARRVPGLTVLRSALAFFVLAAVSEPYWSTFSYGQINILLLWMVLEDLLRPRRGQGVLLGIASGIKLIPAVFILALAVFRSTRAASVAIATLAATVALGWFVLPASSWQYWSGVAYDGARVGGVDFSSNQSLEGVLWRALGHGGSVLLWIVGSLIVGLVGLVAGRVYWLRGLFIEAICCIAVIGLVASPISWSHHFVWTPLFIVVLLLGTPWASRREDLAGRVIAVLWFLAVASRVIWWGPHGGDREYAVSVMVKVASDSYFILAVATLAWLALGARALGRGRAAAARAGSSSGGDAPTSSTNG